MAGAYALDGIDGQCLGCGAADAVGGLGLVVVEVEVEGGEAVFAGRDGEVMRVDGEYVQEESGLGVLRGAGLFGVG